MQIMNKNGFSRCGELYIGLLRKEGRFSTAHVYQNALFSFTLIPQHYYKIFFLST